MTKWVTLSSMHNKYFMKDIYHTGNEGFLKKNVHGPTFVGCRFLA